MPNLWGASPIGRDDGDCSYVAQTVSSGRPHRRCRNRGGVLSTGCDAGTSGPHGRDM